MSFLPLAILAYLLNSVAVTVDKFLLVKTKLDPLIYIFYFSLMSFFAIFAIPFIQMPALQVIILGSVATLCWTLAAFFMFTALKLGRVQRVIPIIGCLTTLVLLILAQQTHAIQNNQILAVMLMIAGLIFLTIGDWGGNFFKKELLLLIGSSIFFAFSYYFLSLAFTMDSFLKVLVYSRIILFPVFLILLFIPATRKKIVPKINFKKSPLRQSGSEASPLNKTALIFIFGQFCAGISELLLTFSISLANPAIVNSLQGLKSVFLLIFSLILGKKFPNIFINKLSPLLLTGQITGVGLIAIGLYILAF